MRQPSRSTESIDPSIDAWRLRLVTTIGRSLAQITDAKDILRVVAHGGRDLFDSDEAQVFMATDPEKSRVAHIRRGDSHAIVETVVGTLPEIGARVRSDEHSAISRLEDEGQEIGLIVIRMARGRTVDDGLMRVLTDQAVLALSFAARAEAARQEMAARIAEVAEDPEHRMLAMSALSHDFRSPLLAIDMGCDILEESLVEPTQEQRDVLRQMRIARQRIQIIGENLVEMERLHVGQASLHCKHVRLQQTIEHSVAVVAPVAAAHGIAIDVSCVTDGLVWADANRLRQAVTNVLSNAVKHSPRDGVVRVACVTGGDDDSAVITVSDAGPGVYPERQETVFQPYYHHVLNGSAGVGIGLAVSRELVRRMGGDLTLEDSVGAGATFAIHLRRQSPR